MPIRLNLLAESQAAEELRRKDPVKRAAIFGGFCVAIMAVASIAIQTQVLNTKRKANGYTNLIAEQTNDFATVMADYNRLQQLNQNIRGLDILASERMLNGSLLNALQKAYVENVQLIRIRAEHTYAATEEVKPKPTAGAPGTPAAAVAAKGFKPATASEKIVLTFEARDISPNPGEQVTKYKETLGKLEHVQQLLGTNNQLRLVNRSPPQLLSESGKLAVQFTLEGRLPEKYRLGISSATRYASPQSVAGARKTVAEDDL